MQLRPYQDTAMKQIQAEYRSGKRRPLLVAPTGAGKSAMVQHMLERTQKRTLILAHRETLVERISDDLKLPHGLIMPGRPMTSHPIQIGMMQTVFRRLDRLPVFQWVISDEAHLAMCPTWMRILHHYAQAWHLGMSATPCRLDGRGLGEAYDAIVMGPSISELTTRGFLVPCRVFAPASQIEGVKKSGSDFNLDAAAQLLNTKGITGDAITALRKLGPGRRTLVFACNRKHAEDVAASFRAVGFRAAAIDGSMGKDIQRRLIAEFRDGRLEVLVNVELLTTGFDCPQIDTAIFLRPTESLALYLQMVGRILRIYPGKLSAILIDLVGNVLRHGLPDEPREWGLDGRAPRRTAPSIRQCPACYAAFLPAPRCPECGAILTASKPKPKRRIEQVADEVVEIDAAAAEALRQTPLREVLKQARTKADLERIARERGYNQRWVGVQMALRARKFRGSQAA